MTDYLTCGQCLREFPLHKINLFIQHKKLDCDDDVDQETWDAELQCSSCPRSFMSSWALLVHVQLTHNMKIFLQRAPQSLQVQSSPLKHGIDALPLNQASLPVQGNNVAMQKQDHLAKVEVSEIPRSAQVEGAPLHGGPVGLIGTPDFHYNQGQGRQFIEKKPDDISGDVSSPPGLVTSQTVSNALKHFLALPPDNIRSSLQGCNIVVTKDVLNNSKKISMNGSDKALFQFAQQTPANNVSQSGVFSLVPKNIPTVTSSDVQQICQVTSACVSMNSVSLQPVVSGPMTNLSTNQAFAMDEKYFSKDACKQVSELRLQGNMVQASKVFATLEDVPVARAELSAGTKDFADSSAGIEGPKDFVQMSNISKEKNLSVKNVHSNVPKQSVSTNLQSSNESHSNRVYSLDKTDGSEQQLDSVTDPPDANSQANESSMATEEEAACLDNNDVDGGMEECCDNQGCGVTVIPGSHQDLQKCCNAVVPKKRKRHMEMKHMPFSWSSSRYAKRKLFHRLLSAGSSKSTFHGKPTGGTIFIDVGSDTVSSDGLPKEGLQVQGEAPTVTILGEGLPSSSANTVSPSDLTPVKSTDDRLESRSRSLILQPGAVFSIPFSYNIPTATTVLSSANSRSAAENRTPAQISMGELQTCDVTLQNQVTVSAGSSTLSSVVENPVVPGFIQQTASTADGTGLVQPFTSGNQLVIDGGELRRRKYPTSRPFQCDKCSMAFNQRIHLKKHMSKHTGVKPYKCGECDYSTVERSHLKVHIRIHTGEKPFKCTFCEYATAQNSTLKIHLKRHHGGKMFECVSCDKKFTQEEQLKGHEWEHGPLAVISPTKEHAASKKDSPADTVLPVDRAINREPPPYNATNENGASSSTSSQTAGVIETTNLIGEGALVIDEISNQIAAAKSDMVSED